MSVVEDTRKKSAFDFLSPKDKERLFKKYEGKFTEQEIIDILQPESKGFATAKIKKFFPILVEKDIKEALRRKEKAASPASAPQNHQIAPPEKPGILKTLEKIIFRRGGKKISQG